MLPGLAPSIAQDRDPHWNSVELLLHFDGANGSTTFLDSSRKARGVTPVGNAQITTAQSVFGGASYLGDGNGDGVSLASSADLASGSSDFTLECRVRFASAATNRQLWVSQVTGGLSWAIEGGNLIMGAYNVAYHITQAWSPALNTWYALALSRTGSTLRMFVDGVQIASYGSAYAYATGAVEIGGQSSAPTRSVNGWMDELRFTKGVGRYTANYTPATRVFPSC